MQNNLPLVSILITLFNGKEFIRETLVSCLNQTYQNIEILIIDDASDDGGLMQIKDLVDKNKIKVIKNSKNFGFICSVNIGIENANGDYILPLGQDDLLDSSHIDNIMPLFNPSVALVYTRSYRIDRFGKNYGIMKDYSHNQISNFRFSLHNCFHSCGLVMNKEKLIKAGSYLYNPRWRHYGEWHLWIRMLNQGTILYCDKSISYYRQHDHNLSKQFSDKSNYKIYHQYSLECMMLAKTISKFSFHENLVFWLHYYKRIVKYQLYPIRNWVKHHNER